MNFDAFVVFIDSLSYGPLIQRPDHLPYSFSWAEASAGLPFGPLYYQEGIIRLISQWPHFPISSLLDSRCTPQFFLLSQEFLYPSHPCGVTVKIEIHGSPSTYYSF